MKRTLSFVFAVLVAAATMAAPRSASQAQAIAKNFLTKNRTNIKMAKPSDLRLAHTAKMGDNNAFYVFNNGDNAGYILISADDNTREVLGYADAGTFDENNMPDNMKVWFRHYTEEVAHAAQQPNIKRLNSTTDQLPAVKRAYTPVLPLLKTTWDQDKPYNNLCPIDQTDNKRSYTGCVATAAAQIMKYWEYPTKGTGEHTDNWDNSIYKGKGSGSEYANFGNTTYDWANMLNKYSGSYSETQANAIATLMYHVGISCDMCYGSDKVGGSGAFTGSMAYGLLTYFGYDKGLRYIMMDLIGYSKFEQLFLAELAAKRPILMGGATKNDEGHEFVCDGVDENGYFHINWGWGGQSDGYFALSALDPEQQGAGGAASGEGFSVQVEAVIGIQPDKGNPLAAPLVDIEYDEKGNYDYQFSKTEAKKSETIKFSTNQAYNSGPADVTNAPVRFAAFKTDSTFYKEFGSNTFSMPAMGENYQTLSVSASFSGLPAGDYLFAIVFRMSDTQEWTPIAFAGEGEYRPLHVTADSVYIGKPQGGGTSGELVVDYAGAIYDDSKADYPWTLITTDQATQIPWIQFYFNSGSNNKIAGEYSLANGRAIVWLTEEDDPDIMSTDGKLKIVCLAAETEEDYALYSIKANFTDENDNEYSVNAELYVPASDKNEQAIELKDKTGSEDIDNTTNVQIKTMKIYKNGVLMIEREGKLFNVQGAQIQ